MPLARLAVPFHPTGFSKYIHGGRCDFVSRNGNAYKSFGALCDEIAAAIPRRAVLDGEIVHLDAAGRPQFYSLLRRRGPQRFIALICSGWTAGTSAASRCSIMALRRRKLLSWSLPGAVVKSAVQNTWCSLV